MREPHLRYQILWESRKSFLFSFFSPQGELIETEETYDEVGEFEEEAMDEEEEETASSPEKNAEKEKTNGTRIILRRTHPPSHDKQTEQKPKKPKYDEFDELKNSN